MLTFYEQYKKEGHSQNGEWGIIEECLKRIGLVPGKLSDRYTAVEFGACDGTWCSNTVDISLNYRGWERILYDLNPGSQFVMKAAITPENVNSMVPECSVLSIDIDGNDHDIWKSYTGTPAIVVIEINSGIMATDNAPVSDAKNGTAYKPMVELAISKDYFLICHTGNCIFVHNKHRELFPEIPGDGVSNWHLYFQTKWLS